MIRRVQVLVVFAALISTYVFAKQRKANAGSGGSAPQARSDMKVQSGATTNDWPSYGGTTLSWRYSTLNQINTTNVKKMAPAWMFATGDYQDGLQSTPLVVDGVVFISSASSYVFALDGATGDEIWEYKYEPPVGVNGAKRNRGLAVGDGKVFIGMRDDYLVALDQKTGKEVWRVSNGDWTTCRCSISGVPLVVKDKVLVGATGPRGNITAYNTKTGHREWRFYTIPAKGEKGNESWPNDDSWKEGGGNIWTFGSYDPELNLTYWGPGDPRPTFWNSNREGTNLYTASIIALDADTGKLRWYYQEVPHDTWDFDADGEFELLDREVKGQMRKVLIHLNKGGFAWVLDRQTGEFLGTWPFAENYNWTKSINEKGEFVGRHDIEEGKPTYICPSNIGAKTWNQTAFSPQTGLMYAPVLEECNDIVTRGPGLTGPDDHGGGTWIMKPPPGHDTGYSHLDAVDPITGKQKWSYHYKYELLASILATAGDLVLTGDDEGHFFALDAKSGQKLWSFQTGATNRGGPVTYMVGGRQFILTPVGRTGQTMNISMVLWPDAPNFKTASSLVSFALPENSK